MHPLAFNDSCPSPPATIRGMDTVIAATCALWPFHVMCIGLLALFCQDAIANRRVTIWSILALTTVIGLELAMLRLIVVMSR